MQQAETSREEKGIIPGREMKKKGPREVKVEPSDSTAAQLLKVLVSPPYSPQVALPGPGAATLMGRLDSTPQACSGLLGR